MPGGRGAARRFFGGMIRRARARRSSLNNPDDIFGTWKGAARIIDHTVSPATEDVTPDADPVNKNNWHPGDVQWRGHLR